MEELVKQIEQERDTLLAALQTIEDLAAMPHPGDDRDALAEKLARIRRTAQTAISLMD